MKNIVAPNSPLNPPNTVVLLGDLLLHRRLFSDSVLQAQGLNIIRCEEDADAIYALAQVGHASIIIARQAFIEALPNTAVMQLTNFGRGIRVLAILEDDNVEGASAVKMLRFGCRGILPHEFSSQLCRRAIHAVLRGELWAPRALVSQMLSDLLRAASLKTESGLTPQEARILELSSQGFANSAIADALFISLETVRWHKRRLNRKLRGKGHARHPQTKVLPPNSELAVS